MGLSGPLSPPKVRAHFGVYVEMCITIIIVIIIITALNGLLTTLAVPALNDLLKPKSDRVTHPRILLLRIKVSSSRDPSFLLGLLPCSPFP